MPASLIPNSDVFMRGGTYAQAPGTPWVDKILGQDGYPIRIKDYPGEHAKIDLKITNFDMLSFGGYHWWMGPEFFSSDTDRVSVEESSDPTDNTRDTTLLSFGRPGLKLINTAYHDLGGLFASAAATDLEVYGCNAYNNGWSGPTKGSGHTLYMQNNTGIKKVKHNVLYNSFGYLFQLYGSDAAIVKNFLIDSNACFGAGRGDTYADRIRDVMIFQGASADNLGFSTITRNQIYTDLGVAPALTLAESGATSPILDVVLTLNRIAGLVKLNEGRNYTVTGNLLTTFGVPLTGQNILMAARLFGTDSFADLSANFNNNAYSTPSAGATQQPFYFRPPGDPIAFAPWQSSTGWDAASSFSANLPASNVVEVWKNEYDPKKAYVVVWNFQDLTTQAVNLSVDTQTGGTFLVNGDTYRIRHIYDWDGARALTSYSGTYSGPVTVGLTGWTATKPIGAEANPAPVSSAPKYNVFIAEKTN